MYRKVEEFVPDHVVKQWNELFAWQKQYRLKHQISPKYLMHYLDLPISCADYLTGKKRPLLEDGSYSKLMSDTLQTIKDSNQIIILTNDQRIMDWYFRNENKLRRDFQIPRLFVKNSVITIDTFDPNMSTDYFHQKWPEYQIEVSVMKYL